MFRDTKVNAFTYGMMADNQQMETIKGMVFGAKNAVTGYFQNVRKYRNDKAKLQSIILEGTAQIKSQKAFELYRQVTKDRAAIFILD